MDWKAKWIWDSGEDSPRNYYLYLRKTFDLPAKPEKVLANVCADSRYKLFINGKLVSRGPVRSDPRWQYYDVVDLTPYLRKGKNVAAALVHHYGTGTFSYILGRGGFLFDCELSYPNKADISVTSDASWKVLPAQAWFRDLPRIDIQMEFNEVYNANLAPDGWTEIGFDDSLWKSAKIIGEAGMEPWPSLVPREIPFMYEREIFPAAIYEVGITDSAGIELLENNKAPVAAIMGREKKHPVAEPYGVISDPSGTCRHPNTEDIFKVQPLNPHGKSEASAIRTWKTENIDKQGFTIFPLAKAERLAGKGIYIVLDFGREVCGHPRIRLSAEGKGVIDLGYGELLTDGKVNPYRGEVNYADRYHIKSGTQEWETFDKRAFRYMQIDFREITSPVMIESISVKFSTYPVRWVGSFECSDDRLNEIWRIGAYTVQINMEDAYTDCPWRERTQWWGDARIEALSNYYAFGDPWLVRQGIKQIGQSQNDEGSTSCFYPGTPHEISIRVIPSFCLFWIMSIWDYYMFTGDKTLVQEIYPKVKKLICWFEGFKDKRGLLTDVPGWMFIEWTCFELYGTITTLNCIYYRALVNASSMARLLHDREAASTYTSRAEEVNAGINSHLYDNRLGVYPEFWSDKDNAFSSKTSQMANGLAAAYGIAPAKTREAILRYTLDPEKDVVPAGSYFAYYYLLALFGNGMIQEALDYIRTNWGVMLDWGATVFWEQWNNNHSLCHGWASAPTIHLPSYVLGVQPTEPGFSRVIIAPNPGDLSWAKGTIPTPRGEIRVEWRRSDRKFNLVVNIPDGVDVNVALPLIEQFDSFDIKVNGHKDLPDGVLGGRLSVGRAMYTISQPGKYAFALSAS